jgi:hypothetical protein
MTLGSTQPLTEMLTRNISCGKGGGCVGLTTLRPPYADRLEISEPQLPGTLWVCPGLIMGLIYLYLYLTNNHSRDVDCFLNVMAHAQKPDFVFRRNVRVHLNRRGRQFRRLLAAEVCASAVVMLDTPCSEVVWRVLATHSIRQFPLHFPFRVSPCAVTFQLDSTPTLISLSVFQLRSWTLEFHSNTDFL